MAESVQTIDEGTESLLDLNEFFFTPTEDIVMIEGSGIYLKDNNGKEYIDCASATFNLSLGYSHPDVINAVKEQADKLIHVTSSYMTNPVGNLVKKLIEVSPEGLSKVHLKISGGSTANEGAIKMAQHYNGKTDVISLFRSHVGQTIFTMNASGNSFRREPFHLGQPGIVHVPPAYCYRCFYNQKPETCGMLCVERINDFIDYASSGQVSSMIVEPILGNGDNITPPAAYFPALRKLCDERNITLIFDEIQTGIGRTGHMFAAQYYGVTPDIITTAKGLGGTGFQVAAIITKPEYAAMEGHHHSFTYGSNLLSAAAAVKTLEIVWEKSFLQNVADVGKYIMKRLWKLQEIYSVIGDVRGVGLMIGIEIVDDENNPDVNLTGYIKKKAFEYGLIMRTSRYGYGNVLKIRPPLTITMEQADELCNRLESCFNQIFRKQ
ncbi:aspartate aminotransferase family protein [Paenibacillus cymbidii]|uniref:aspartate aminotransferase family protein n=1 Tax=Paenibacillus cymbidii TaxID=1639034 RepID=UPI001F1D8E9D|nr:aspartate aminotransferase family protein [Paenibacillus cymbidii]